MSLWSSGTTQSMVTANQSAAHGEFERYRVLLRAEIGVEPTTRLSQLLQNLEPRA